MKRYDSENLKVGQAVVLWLKRGGLYNPNDVDPTYQRTIGIVCAVNHNHIIIDLGDKTFSVYFTEIAFFISYTEDK